MTTPAHEPREEDVERVALAVQDADERASQEAEGAANGLNQDVSDWGAFVARAALSAMSPPPPSDDLREAVARIVDPVAYQDFPVGGDEPDQGLFPSPNPSDAEDEAWLRRLRLPDRLAKKWGEEDKNARIDRLLARLRAPRVDEVSRDTLIAMCKAHDAEDAAQHGEPSPWVVNAQDIDPDWVDARITAMRAALQVKE